MASVANAWNNLLDRQRARFESHRVDSNEDGLQHEIEPEHHAAVVDEETAPVVARRNDEMRVSSHHRHRAEDSPPGDSTGENNSDDDDDDVMADEESGNLSDTSAAATTGDSDIAIPTATTATHTMTLAELEEERELARRRSSACVMFAVFVLFRLWIIAIQEGDFGILMLCLVGTSWTARWIRHNREREEELDRRIAQYLEQQQSGNTAAGATVDRNDLRMLSFQAQLALAIMESQRQMMANGGYGNPDESNQTPGVSEEAKSRWEHFPFKTIDGSKSHHTKRKSVSSSSTKGGYGSVSQAEDALMKPGKTLSDNLDDEEPHCSICLCEYEDGETLVKLPCSHFYHDECINSWTSNHVKCPLCNFDLETAQPASTNDESIV